MANRTGFDSVYHLIGSAQNRAVSKAGCHGMPAVDAGKRLIFRIAAQLQRLFDDRREIAFLINVHHFRIRDHFRGKHTVCIARARRHQAVCGKQNRRRKVVKFLLLVLPSRAEIALQLRIFFQLRIAVRRKHLAVRIHSNALVLGLFQQTFEVVQIVSGDNDKRPFFNGQRNGCRLRCAVGLRICLVQQCHAGKIFLSDFQNNRQQLIHAPCVLSDCTQRFDEKCIQLRIGISQNHRMIGICRHTANAEQNERF